MIENTILENMPMKFLELTQAEVHICWDDGVPYLDMQTGMKSHMYLYWKDGQYFTKQRYDEKNFIQTFHDFAYALRSCDHGRCLMDGQWVEIFNNSFGEFNWDKFE